MSIDPEFAKLTPPLPPQVRAEEPGKNGARDSDPPSVQAGSVPPSVPSSIPPSQHSNGVPASIPPPSQRIAVVVNGNARSVTEEVISMLDQIMLGGDLFVSRSLEEASEIAKTVIDRGYGTVLTGGGDGTFTTMVTRVVREAQRQRRPQPRFGFLKLGTGNALAHVVGASGASGLAADIQRLKVDAGSRKIGLVEVDDILTPFCGFGVDALVVEDYQRMKESLSKTPLRKISSGLLGYALASTTRTIPRYLMSKPPTCKVTNVGAEAFRMGPKGQLIGEPVKNGEVLYSGPARMVGVSTIPYFGFGLRAFPYAEERADRMQVRLISDLGFWKFATHIRELWNGTFEAPGLIFDFLVDEVLIEMSPAAPFQVGGDSVGMRRSVRVRLSRKPIRLVDFYAPPSAT